MILIQELRLLLTGYKKILVGIFFLTLFCALMVSLIAALPGRLLFAPFTIGVVDNDNAPEIRLMLEMLKSAESLSSVVGFERMNADDARLKLDGDEIPAYIIVPPGFTQGVMTGENPPLTLIGNESRVIQLSVAKLIAGAGVAFLTTSQAGIYSALDYAYERGIPWEDVTRHLVMPINIEYMKALLAYNDYFVKTELSPTEGIDKYYLNSALIFLMSVMLVAFMDALLASTNTAAMKRYRMCGIPIAVIMLVKLAAVWLLLSALLLPAYVLYGARIFAIALLLGGLAIMSSQLWRSEQAAGLFLFSFAVLSAFASGGALPLAFLPDIFGKLCRFIPNYWFIRINEPLAPAALCVFGLLFFCVAVIRAGASFGVRQK